MAYREVTYAEGVYEYFFFEKNLQGDIIAVYNAIGTKLVTYKYDAWGAVTTTYQNGGVSTNVVYNPFRYRGYYYDTETGYYYLQSRYYNPNWGRFINADACLYSSMLGFNMFAYCENNPINYLDPSGECGLESALVGWGSSAWGLTLVDGPLPIGDLIYIGGCIILGGILLVKSIMLVEETVDIIQDATDGAPDATSSQGRPKDENGKPIVKPGEVPGEEEGYYPPKEGPIPGKTKDGKKGWIDANGNIWVPVPTGSQLAHGGGHWDVNRGDGKGYINVYPGGKVRKGKGKIPIFKH